jgi:hypothetical protein
VIVAEQSQAGPSGPNAMPAMQRPVAVGATGSLNGTANGTAIPVGGVVVAAVAPGTGSDVPAARSGNGDAAVAVAPGNSTPKIAVTGVSSDTGGSVERANTGTSSVAFAPVASPVPIPPPAIAVAVPSVDPASTTLASPSTMTAGTPPMVTGPLLDAASLIPPSAPILLPDFTVPGDETSTLMLPSAPEISQLPKAFAAAVMRLSDRPQTIITFVDPRTGRVEDDDASADAGDHAWLLVDPRDADQTGLDDGVGAAASLIQWDSPPPDQAQHDGQ